jgi:hypothetical protein
MVLGYGIIVVIVHDGSPLDNVEKQAKSSVFEAAYFTGFQ